MRAFVAILFCLLFSGFSPVLSQEINVEFEQIDINIDSLIQDSLSKAFILNHKPLTNEEIALSMIKKQSSPYGLYIKHYLESVRWYSLAVPQLALYSPQRIRPHLEWIFYSFLFLFLITALLAKFSNGLLRKLWKIYVNDGFIYRQSKEQMVQLPIVSVTLNILFILSCGLFIFFGMGWNLEFKGESRWLILATSFVVIALIYIFKYVFLSIIGWAFGEEVAFGDYLFVVFLNNKLSGLIFLFSAFIMAFSTPTFSTLIFKLTLFFIGLMLLYRFLRGYQIFSGLSKTGFFTLLLAFLSLEIIPTVIIVKFITRSIDLWITGVL